MSALVQELVDRCLTAGTPEAAVNLLRNHIQEWRSQDLPRTTPMQGPVWEGLESRTWDAGEALRQVLQQKKAWLNAPALHQFLLWALDQQDLGKGRQPFTELARVLPRGEFEASVLDLLKDHDLRGHAIKALRSGRALSYSAEVGAVMESERRGWVKREAKKYLKLAQSDGPK